MTIKQLNDMKLKVKGFSKLSEENQLLFKKFIYSYLQQYEYPQNHIPIQVSPKQGYLKVQFKDYWLHVVSANKWY